MPETPVSAGNFKWTGEGVVAYGDSESLSLRPSAEDGLILTLFLKYNLSGLDLQNYLTLQETSPSVAETSLEKFETPVGPKREPIPEARLQDAIADRLMLALNQILATVPITIEQLSPNFGLDGTQTDVIVNLMAAYPEIGYNGVKFGPMNFVSMVTDVCFNRRVEFNINKKTRVVHSANWKPGLSKAVQCETPSPPPFRNESWSNDVDLNQLKDGPFPPGAQIPSPFPPFDFPDEQEPEDAY